jgi:acyl carrier protein
MVPSFLFELDSLPLTPNGKIDKKALPDFAMRKTNASYVAPRSETERTIGEIWRKLLAVNDAGVMDNFFDLGGDSIKVIRMVNELRKAFTKEIKVFDIYQAGTIERIAKIISKDNAGGKNISSEYELVKKDLSVLKDTLMQRRPDAALIEDIYPMSDIQIGMVYSSLRSPELAIYHDQFVHFLSNELDIAAFKKALVLLVRKHDILRTAFDLDTHSEGISIIYREVTFDIDCIDLEHMTRDESAIYNREYLAKQRDIPFTFYKDL